MDLFQTEIIHTAQKHSGRQTDRQTLSKHLSQNTHLQLK